MALEEFENEQPSDREKNLIRMKSITNYVMGIFLIGVGVMFLYPTEKMKPFIDQYDHTMIIIFSILCFVYGAFRIYRGYAKNYFKD